MRTRCLEYERIGDGTKEKIKIWENRLIHAFYSWLLPESEMERQERNLKSGRRRHFSCRQA